MAILQAINIKKEFIQGDAKLEVLKGISATFEQGKSYAIIGPSGSGKSTFMHILAGIDDPNEGAVTFNGFDINIFSADQRKLFLTESIGLVFQLPYLIQELTVLENVMLKGLIEGRSAEECKHQAQELLLKVGLTGKDDAHPFSLSGGEQQRVALARALFNKPAFLLADEPTGNLDIHNGKLIVELLHACQQEWNMGIIVSSHDAYVAEGMETILRMEDGELKS
jgi:ABC-type lipoprotein export system ATPase subunit